VCLALSGGTFFGLMFIPVLYIQDNYKDASQFGMTDCRRFIHGLCNLLGLPYVFAHFCGTNAALSIVFVLYTLIYRKRVFINAKTTFPAILSGCLDATGQAAFLVANRTITQAIAFPLNSFVRFDDFLTFSTFGHYFKGPAIIASLWDVFYYKEIKVMSKHLCDVNL
jgi:hypothetical protein